MNATRYATMVSASGACLLVLLLHFLAPEFNPLTRPMSDYATGRFGFLMAGAIATFGVSVLCLARALANHAPRTSVALLNVAGVAYLVAGIFPTDALPDETVISFAGAVHFIAGYLSSPLIVSAAILLTRERRAFAFALVLWATLIALVVVNALHLQIGGIGQRIFMTLVVGWVVETARRGVSTIRRDPAAVR